MNKTQNDRKHLTPRQIINRFRKGKYIDESFEYVSSVVSSCSETFDSVAIPFPITIAEMVVENITIIKTLYERKVAGLPVDDVSIPNYPQLKDFLMDLSEPELWEAMGKDENPGNYWNILEKYGLSGKYILDNEASISNAVDYATGIGRDAIKSAGLSTAIFNIALYFMLRNE